MHCMHQSHPEARLYPPRGSTYFHFEGTMVTVAVPPVYLPEGRMQEEQPHQNPGEPAAWDSEGRQNRVQASRLAEHEEDRRSQRQEPRPQASVAKENQAHPTLKSQDRVLQSGERQASFTHHVT